MMISKKILTRLFMILAVWGYTSGIVGAVTPLVSTPFSISNEKLGNKNYFTRVVTIGGTSARVFLYDKDRLGLEIFQDKNIGWVELSRSVSASGASINATFSSGVSGQLAFSSKIEEKGLTSTIISHNGNSVRLIHKKNANQSQEVQNRIEKIFSSIAADAELNRLIKSSLPFLHSSNLNLIAPSLFDQSYVPDCAVEATDCLMSLIAYGMSMSALVSTCGFSFGAGCVGALLAHPVFAGAIAIYCGRAIESCGISK